MWLQDDSVQVTTYAGRGREKRFEFAEDGGFEKAVRFLDVPEIEEVHVP